MPTTLFHKNMVAQKYNKLKINEHNIFTEKKESQLTSVNVCYESHDIADYPMHGIY